jgi:hypothetical protein
MKNVNPRRPRGFTLWNAPVDCGVLAVGKDFVGDIVGGKSYSSDCDTCAPRVHTFFGSSQQTDVLT